MSKPRGASDPPPVNTDQQPDGYISFSLPINLGKTIPVAEPFASISASALLSQDVSHSGWIRKEGSSVKSWKSRFMVLHHGCLYYFQRTDSGSPKGQFALNDCRCEKAPERSNDDRYPYVFKVVPNDEKERTYYFSSPSKAEMEVANRLQRVKKIHRGQRCPDFGYWGWIEKIDHDIKLYCTASPELYDYAEPGQFCLIPKYPTVPKKLPPTPKRRNESIPSSPDAAFPKSFPLNSLSNASRSPILGLSPSSCHHRPFPKLPRDSPHRSPDSDSEDSVDDESPEGFYYEPDGIQEVIYTECKEKEESYHTKTAPPKPPPKLPKSPDGSPVKRPFKPRAIPPVPVSPPPDSDEDEESSLTEGLYLEVLPEETPIFPPPKSAPKPRPKPLTKPPKVQEDKEAKQDDFDYLPSHCYQPEILKQQAKVFLELCRTNGSYIIHKSEKSDTTLVLSVWVNNGAKRYYIFKRDELFTLYPTDTDEQFPDLHELVKYYFSHSLPKTTQMLTAPFTINKS